MQLRVLYSFEPTCTLYTTKVRKILFDQPVSFISSVTHVRMTSLYQKDTSNCVLTS